MAHSVSNLNEQSREILHTKQVNVPRHVYKYKLSHADVLTELLMKITLSASKWSTVSPKCHEYL